MKYYKIEDESNPQITGTRVTYSVEIKDRHSFESNEVKNIWRDYFDGNIDDWSRTRPETFVQLDASLVANKVKYFPIGKKVKQLDIVNDCPHLNGIQLLVNQRTYDIISRFRLSIHNKIPVRIDTFDDQYYLFGVPSHRQNDYDYSQSVFVYESTGKDVIFKNVDGFNSAKEIPDCKEVKLLQYIESDIICAGPDLFVSEVLLNELKKEGVVGYEVTEVILNN